jgi:THO complex subunit 2
MLRLYFLPALTLIRGNAVCTVEVWNILRFMQPAERWKLYGEWKATAYKSHPELRVRHVQVDREAKGLLRRLSHQTIDSLSGPVAKLVHSNPLVFFANAVNQVMAYDNMAGVVIQAIKFVTTMGFDTLVYTILEALSNPDKERVKDDGVNISDWLQSECFTLHASSQSQRFMKVSLHSLECCSGVITPTLPPFSSISYTSFITVKLPKSWFCESLSGIWQE